ncbi:MAG: hypothetical protein HUJ13_04725 [Hydrogenovibrio crunogenus]|uniref:Uncharacterized protein n=1 Tax=Hydrogenovibrio crunogenus (strain DSM 25203 / XCL-2) TaxID=317025 RepID=Q31I44_HYDCU|nr:hypothetical protein [Hydrogenovibrio crunogenus]
MQSKPYHWIRLELVPLPGLNDHVKKVLYWNPDAAELIGDGAEEILQMIQIAQKDGFINGSSISHFEITSPLNKPSELAAILTQYYWIVPEPVMEPVSESINQPGLAEMQFH